MEIQTEKADIPVLELHIEKTPAPDMLAKEIEFAGEILPGQLVYVQIEHVRDLQPFVSMFLGLSSTKTGQVKFCGEDWQAISYDQQFRLRSQVGRVFAGPAWIQNLTVGENLWLSQLNQRQKPADIKKRIDDWLPRLAGVHADTTSKAMARRPAFVVEPILQICQLLRAFAFRPRLLILERPLRFLPSDLHEHLLTTIQETNRAGAATVWFDMESEPALLAGLTTLRRWAIKDEALIDREAA